MSVRERTRSDQRPAEAWRAFPPAMPERAADPEDRLEAALAWTTHELRGPVLAARAALDRVLAGDSLAPGDRGLLVRSRDVLTDLSGQIDTVLRWSAGARRLRRRRVDLGTLVRRVADRSIAPAEEQRVSVLVEAGVAVRADAPLLRAAVADVLRNALDYSPAGSPVHVRVQRRGDRVRITVRDRGPGVPAQERESVFEPFVRGREASARAGTGLGLFIARRVVRAHGGEIWLESNGDGTTVVVELPSEGTAP